MTDVPPLPHRRVRFTIEGHADTNSVLADELREIADRIERVADDRDIEIFAGGTVASYSVNTTVDVDMTPERYWVELDAWRAAEKVARTAAAAEVQS